MLHLSVVISFPFHQQLKELYSCPSCPKKQQPGLPSFTVMESTDALLKPCWSFTVSLK